MDTVQHEEDLSKWFSTYGLITAERILGKYHINLKHEVLLAAVKNSKSFFNRLLHIPLKHVLNGIVLQQGNDFHVYAQKLFIDYLLSGDSHAEEGAPGGGTRDALEEERVALVALGEQYNQLTLAQDTLIASSQSVFIKITQDWNSALEAAVKTIAANLKSQGTEASPNMITSAVYYAVAHCSLSDMQSNDMKLAFIDAMNVVLKANLNADTKEKMLSSFEPLFSIASNFEVSLNEFYEQTQDINHQARSIRTQFYDTILRVIDLIKLLPEYKLDPEQDSINRGALDFDKSIGGD